MTERPDWMDDETKPPPYPLLRCPTCKKIFSDHAIHVCAREFLHPDFQASVMDDKQRGES